MADHKTDNWPLGLLEVCWAIDITPHKGLAGMKPFQVHFAGRMPFLSEDYWLNAEERKTAKVVNEDGEPSDDEEAVDDYIRFERTSSGISVPSARALPGAQLRENQYGRQLQLPTFNIATPSRTPRIGNRAALALQQAKNSAEQATSTTDLTMEGPADDPTDGSSDSLSRASSYSSWSGLSSSELFFNVEPM